LKKNRKEKKMDETHAAVVLICGIVHETNTFATNITGKTTLSDFYQSSGKEIIMRYSNTKTITGGFLSAANELNYKVIPGYLAVTEPSGIITDRAYEHMKGEIMKRVHEAISHNLDCVALELHGAGVAESYQDIEGDLVTSIREIVGNGIKIICGLDC
jgi:microcystin degradation protein MlrC